MNQSIEYSKLNKEGKMSLYELRNKDEKAKNVKKCFKYNPYKNRTFCKHNDCNNSIRFTIPKNYNIDIHYELVHKKGAIECLINIKNESLDKQEKFRSIKNTKDDDIEHTITINIIKKQFKGLIIEMLIGKASFVFMENRGLK